MTRYSHRCTFSDVKLHERFLAPFADVVNINLKGGNVRVVNYLFINYTIVSEQTNRGRNMHRKVIDINKK